MRKLLFIFACVLFTLISKAQLGIQTGGDLYKSKISSNSVSVSYNYKFGFTGGVFYSIPLGNDFSIVPGVDFVQKGGKLTMRTLVDGNPVYQVSSNVTLNYIQVPVNIIYTFKGFFIAAGPTDGMGISGKEKDSESAGSTTANTKTDIHFGSGDNDDLKRFEIGADIILGYKLSNGLFINASYNPGISNLAPKSQGDSKFRNSGFALRIGYMLPSKRKSNS